MAREQWGSRTGFVLAAVGSAVGLGNIWRFPYMVYDNGGGAFLIPFFFALITAGIPILIMEFSLGHQMQGSAPLTFAKVNRKWEWLGWWQVLINFIIGTYYVVIVAWSLNYLIFSFTQAWGTDSIGFFTGKYLGLTSNALDFGALRTNILLTVIIVWFLNFIVLFSGVKKGIEKASRVFIPLLFGLMMIMLVRGITLPGAAEGLNFLFKPDFSKILDPKVWVAAYGQVFYSLSICFGIMLAYSSYLPPKSDINNNAFMTAFADAGFCILAGITVFSIVGFMSHQAGVPLSELKLQGVFLAFATFPEAIIQLPVLKTAFGILFFTSLFFAGLSSMVSINEAAISAIMDKFNLGRKVTVSLYCAVAFLISLIYVTGAGLYILDIVDHFINNYGVAVAGLVELILIAWFYNLSAIKEHANSISDFKVGKWWDFSLKILTPIVLGIMSVQNLYGDITVNYGDHPTNAILIFGWLSVTAIIFIGIAMQKPGWRNKEVLKIEKNRGINYYGS